MMAHAVAGWSSYLALSTGLHCSVATAAAEAPNACQESFQTVPVTSARFS